VFESIAARDPVVVRLLAPLASMEGSEVCASPSVLDDAGRQQLVDAGASPTELTNDGDSPSVLDDAGGRGVFESIAAGDLDNLRRQLEGDPALVSREDEWGRLPLQHAAKCGQVEAVDLLVSVGAPLEGTALRGGYGWTALIVGALWNQPEVVKRLIRHGADVSAMTKAKETALQFAAAKGNSKVVQELLAAGASVSIGGSSPLHYASGCGRVVCTQQLLDAGASASVLDGDGESPLHKAAEYNHPEVVRLLAPRTDKDLVGAAPSSSHRALQWILSLALL
jgi:ankyrin repeat protein